MTASAKPPREPLFTTTYVLVSVSSFLMLTAFSFFFIFPLFILQIGGNKTDIGILMGIMSLSAVLCRPWISVRVDSIGRKKSYATGCIIMVVVSLLYPFFERNIDSVFFIHLILRFIHGAGFAFCVVSSYTMATDLIPKTRLTEGLGLFGITALLGMAIGPLLAEAIIHQAGFTSMFVISTMISLAALGVALPIKDAYIFQAHKEETSFFKMLQHPILLRVAIIALCFGIGFSAQGSFVPPYAQSKGLLVSIYFIAYSTAAIITRLVGGRLADRLGEIRIIPFGLLITAIGFISLTQVDTLIGLFASGLVTGTGHGVLLPCLLSLAIRPMSPQNRGKATGIFSGGTDLGVFIGSMLLGVIGEYTGFTTIFLLASSTLLAGLLLVLLWRKRLADIPNSQR